MKTLIQYLPTGEVFENRKEAKMMIGHGKYNRALKKGEIAFVSLSPDSDSII